MVSKEADAFRKKSTWVLATLFENEKMCKKRDISFAAHMYDSKTSVSGQTVEKRGPVLTIVCTRQLEMLKKWISKKFEND